MMNDRTESIMKNNLEIADNHLPASREVAPDIYTTSPPPVEARLHGPFESCMAFPITLRSLGNSLPSERGLVAACLIEIARQINGTVPADSENQHHPQH